MTVVSVAVQRLEHAADLALPAYESELAAGADLLAALPADMVIPSLGRAKVATGIAIALPPGYEAQIRPRSGLAVRHGITVLNAPGTVDADYRGEVSVLLVNLGPDPVTITRGMRIAQLVVAPVTRVQWAEVEALPETARGAGGFGSTGLMKGE